MAGDPPTAAVPPRVAGRRSPATEKGPPAGGRASRAPVDPTGALLHVGGPLPRRSATPPSRALGVVLALGRPAAPPRREVRPQSGTGPQRQGVPGAVEPGTDP